jgi:predicted RNase H-like nuclease (RuvC/YqgF family)
MASKKHLLRSENTTKLFQCPDCKKTFSHLSTLSHHKKNCSQKQNPNNESETHSTEVQSLRKENQEIKERLEKLDQEMDELKKKMEILCKEERNFCIIQRQGRRHIKKEVREEVVKCQENKCNLCNSTLSKYFQIDHITALQYGGTDEFENLQALCCECHCKKSIIENTVRKKIRTAIGDIIEDALHEENQGT